MIEFLTNPWLYYGSVLFFFAISIGAQLFGALHLNRMTKEAENLEDGDAVILKKYILDYIKEENKISNISVFLDKCFRDIKIGKISFLRIKHLSGQALLFAVFLSGTGACVGIIAGKTVGQILPNYILAFLGLYLYFSVSGWLDFEERKKQIKTNLLDFLEHKKYVGIYRTESREENSVEEVREMFSKEEERQLKELLKEIFT